MSDTAVIEAPKTEAPKTEAPAAPPGRISFKEAMAKAEAQAAPAQPVARTEPVQQQDASAKESPKDAPKEPSKTKPRSAVDALLSSPPAAEPKKDATPEDPLKDFRDDKTLNVAKLRHTAEEAYKRVHELEARVGQPDPKLTGELETVRKTLTERETALKEMEARMAEYKDAMVAVNIELDPDYRREFIDGRKQLVGAAAAKLKTYGGNAEALAEALSLPEGMRRDEAIEAALPDSINDTAKAKIMRAVAEVEALDEKRAAILSKPQAAFEELERRHSAQQQAAAEQAEAVKKATFDKVARELATTVPTLGFADETLEGGKEWNETRAANNAAALKLLSDDVAPEQIVAASIKAADYDRLTSLYIEARKAIAERDARLAEYEGAQPDAKGRKTPVPTKAEELAKMTPGQRWKAAMGTSQNDDF